MGAGLPCPRRKNLLKKYTTEVVIAGGGLAGIVAAYELLDSGRRVLLIDKDKQENFGGLAKQSFGGVHMICTPHQQRLGIKDAITIGDSEFDNLFVVIRPASGQPTLVRLRY